MPSATTAKWMFILGSCLIAPALAFLGCWAYQTHLDHLDPVPVATADDGPPPWEQARHDNPYYLRADPRLQTTIAAVPEHPKLQQIVDLLRDRTALDLTVDPGLSHHRPDYGVFQAGKSGFHAWQLMEYIARRDLRYGYWQKTDQGYRLVGTSTAPVAPPGPEEGAEGRIDRMAAVWGSSLVVLWVFLLVLYRKAVREAKQPVAGSAESGAK